MKAIAKMLGITFTRTYYPNQIQYQHLMTKGTPFYVTTIEIKKHASTREI